MIGFYNGKTLNPTDFESKKKKTASEKKPECYCLPVIVPDSVYRIKGRYHRYIFSKEWWWRKESKEKKKQVEQKKVVNLYCEKSDQSDDDDDDQSIE